MMTQQFLVLLLAILVASTASLSAAQRECCLCDDECSPVAPEKVALFTVSPFPNPPEGGVTCEDIAMELLEYGEDSPTCASVRMDLHEACCTEHFGKPARQLASYQQFSV